MPVPQDQRLSLEAETEDQPLHLDLWIGFSAPIKLTLVTVDENAERNDQSCYALPHQVIDDDDTVQIHLARALSYGLLVVKDADGNAIEFDHTADNDTWSPDGQIHMFPDLCNVEQRELYLSMETASLLTMFRRNLRPELQYCLAIATEFLTIPCGNSEKGDDVTAAVEHEHNRLPFQIQCDQSPISFTVVQGTEVPRFDISLSSNTTICSTTGNDSFELCIAITSHASMPVMLGAVNGQWYRDTNLAAGWSCNAFWSLWRLFLKRSLMNGYDETFDYDVWQNYILRRDGRPSVHLFPGNYRREIQPLADSVYPSDVCHH